MAENENNTKVSIEVSAVTNKANNEKVGKDVADGVIKGVGDKGHIKVPVDITVPIDKNNDKLTKAQNVVVKAINKMTKEGFVASGKDVDDLTSKFKQFTKNLDQAGKGRQNKIFREIRKQVEDLQKTYNNLKVPKVTPKITGAKTRKVKTKYDEYLDKQENYSKKSQGAGERVELNKELDYARKNKSLTPSSGNIRETSTDENLMRLSEFSSHGSKWASELARILEEEKEKSAKTLVKYIDPQYAKNTKGGRKTTEEEFLTDTVSVVLKDLRKAFLQLESGSKDVTLDQLKEYAAVIKVLNTQLGRTVETTDMMIHNTIEKRYSDSEKKRMGFTDLEEGQEKGIGPGHKYAKDLRNQLYKSMKQWDKEVSADKIAREILTETEKTLNRIDEKRKGKRQTDEVISKTKESDAYKNDLERLNSAIDDTTKAVESNTTFTKIGNTKETIDSTNEQKIEKENVNINTDTAKTVEEDKDSGFNTQSNSDAVINILKDILSQIKILLPKDKDDKNNIKQKVEQSSNKEDRSFEMSAAYDTLAEIFEPIPKFKALMPLQNSMKKSLDIPKGVSKIEWNKIFPKLIKSKEPPYEPKVGTSKVYASPIEPIKNLIYNIEKLSGSTKEYDDILNATAEDQDKLAAERIVKYGLNNGRNPNDTGDIARIKRALELFRANKTSIETNKELLQNIKLTPSINIDTTEITKSFNKILRGKQMRNAQMGGSPLRQAFGAITGFIGMPSLEKSRAIADGLNQVFANMNDALQRVTSSIQTYETNLRGLEEEGKAQFDDEGNLIEGTSAAKKTFADLEESKLVLQTILADYGMMDELIKKTGGNYAKLIKHMSFSSAVLKNNNNIIRNLNAGLDKGGKALKFQRRTAEILNYTFQLMSRSAGQVLKSWLRMLNPINWVKGIAGQIKSLFADFGSYDVKWQRTMNVIKVNFQRIMKPAMEWIAQKLVNIIGFFDIISQKIQSAFGNIPISLFDQAGAQSEQIRRNLEAAANVTLGFDELHDVGTDQSGANDLMGEIYKPQLSKEWEDLANKIGDTLGSFFKGDLGFGEVCNVILELLGKLLGDIGKKIWDWFKQTAIGKYITEHWKGILATILTAFLTWKLLKIAGSTLFNALFGKLLEKGAISGIFSKLGGWISNSLSSLSTKDGILGFVGNFGQGIMMAFQTLFAGGKYSLIGTLKEMFTNSAAITEAGSWGSMIGFALTKGLLATLTGYATYKVIDHFGNNLADKTSYNLGIEYAGGKEEDKKGTFWDKAGAIGGGAAWGAITGGIVGGLPGAIIGGIIGGVAGTIQTVLRPALEKAEVAARSLNGELQSVSFNEAQVQVFQEQSDVLKQQLDLLKQSLDLSTQSVYDQGEKLGISKTRMDELIEATQNGTFTTSMLTDSETELSSSLTDLAQKQEHAKEVAEKLEEAQKKLLKAQTELSIAQDIEAGNFEIAAARIEVAEAQGVYSTEEATDRRIELFEKCADEERANLLQDLTPDQRKRMTDLNSLTDIELAKLNTAWQNSSETTRNAILDGLDENTQAEFKRRMDQIDQEIESHKGFWQGIGDTLAEIFSFGHANTWTYNGEVKYEDEVRKGKIKIQKNALGTNYVEADGLQYLHQGEAIIPKKYNQPYQPDNNSNLESAINELTQQVRQISSQVNQGINVSGEFRQRGSDLVATVERAKNKNGNQPLNNMAFAR